MFYTVYRKAIENFDNGQEEYTISIEDILFGRPATRSATAIPRYLPSSADTLTIQFDDASQKLKNKYDFFGMLDVLEKFNKKYEGRFIGDMQQYYYSFTIPKKTGHGRRQIDAPNDELKTALYELKNILENDFGLLYHTSAFAYIKGRSTIDAVKRHQSNQSRWFLKIDFSNFFGSTTKDFAMKQLQNIFPMSEIMRWDEGREAVSKALDLAFLHGGLPQGTPISPMLTNIIMIPIDFQLSRMLNTSSPHMVYTRYADDILISSRYDFKYTDIIDKIKNALKSFDAPFIIKPEKTRYGSSAGRNWNLGVMLNKDNQITIGYRKKERFKAMLNNFIRDYEAGEPWGLEEAQHFAGLISYYEMVEKDYIKNLIDAYSKKYNQDIRQILKNIISGKALSEGAAAVS